MMDREVMMVIDDELAPRVLAQEAFGVEWDFFSAKNGKEGVELYKRLVQQQKKPDVVLVDIMMPGMDGFLVSQSLREIDSEVIILLWSVAVDNIDIAHEMSSSGANDILDKLDSNPTLLKRQVDLCLKKIKEARITKKEDRILKFKNLEMAFSAIDIPIIQTDESENIIIANEAFRQLSGYDSEQLTNMSFFTLIPPEDHSYLIGHISSRKSGVTRRFEITLSTKTGQEKTVGINSFPMYDGNGNFTGATAIINDLTLQKTRELQLFQRERELKEQVSERTLMLAKEARFWKEIMNSIPGVFFVTNMRGRIVKANKATRILAGTNNVIGRSACNVIYGRTIEDCNLKALMEGKVSIHHLEEEREDGTVFEVSLFPLKNEGAIEGIVHTFNDITLHKQAEKLMNDAKNLAEAANFSKSNFLATMSHEIRTPMNAIIGFNHILLDSDLDEYQKEYAENVRRAAEGLLVIINDILDFSKIEEGKMSLENIPFSLDEVLESVVDMTIHKIEGKDIELVIDIQKNVSTNLKGDPQRLKQILTNLTFNAAKFTEKGEITISIKTKDETVSLLKLEISIRDTGIGIGREHITRLFELFNQADSTISRRYGGTGLGLAISKRLTEMMGGSIAVESELNEGSVFTFDVIIEKDLDVPGQEKPFLEILRDLNVLLMEENKNVRRIISRILRSLSFSVSDITSGNGVLKKLTQSIRDKNPYQLLILSLKSPSDENIQVLDKIRNNENLKNVKIILLIRKQSLRKDYKNIIDQYNISDVITKPVTETTIINDIYKAFGFTGIESQERFAPALKKDDLSGIAGAHVLLVEDLEVNSQLIAKLVQKIPLHITVAKNGKDAIEMLGATYERPIELILMDVHMPVMNGLEATKKIRKTPEYKELPIIALTASAMASDRKKSKDAGMDDFLGKPIDANHLYEKLVQWIPEKKRVPLPVTPNNNIVVETSIPSIKGINMEDALSHTGGDIHLLKKMMKTFSESNFVELIDSMRSELREGNLQQVKLDAHKLKGACNNIGAFDLGLIAFDIEKGKLKNEKNEVLIDRLELELIKVLEGIEKEVLSIMPIYDATNGEYTDIGDKTLRNKLEELKSLMEMHDIKSVELFRQLMPTMLNKEFNRLSREIETFNFENALSKIDHILKITNQNGESQICLES